MKSRFSNSFLGSLVVSAAMLLTASHSHSAALTWSGGSGNWQTGVAGGWSAAWNNVTPDSGTFNGAGGTVDVLGPVITAGGTAPLTGGLTFAGTGNYTLSASGGPQSVTVGTTTNSLVSIASGRTAIIGNNVTLQRPGTAGGWYLSGGGILEIATGGAFNNSATAGNEIANGTTLRINGGTATLGGSLAVGVLTGPGAGPGGTLIVDSGSLSIGGTGNLAIGRVNGETTVGTINNGSITVSGGNLNFGTGTTSPTATFNLNGGTLTVKAVTSTVNANSTFNFNGGTLKAAPSATAAFMSGIDTARIRTGAAIIDSNGQAITISQVLAHSALGGDPAIDGGLTLNDSNGTPGSLTLTGSNTFNGATKITSGILSLGNSLALQSSSLDTASSVTGTAASGLKTTVATLTFGGLTGNKDLADVFTTASGGYSTVTALTLNPGSAISHSYSGIIANGAAAGMTLTKTGAGTQTLSGANTYTGATDISAGTLSAANIVVSGGNSHLGNAASAVTLGSAGAQGTLSYTGNSAIYTRGFTIGGAGGGRLDVTTAGQTLTVNTGAITGSGLFTIGGTGLKVINAAITHTGGLTKTSGSGSITLSNSSNSYDGVTTISGVLIVTANNALGSTAGGTTVNASSTLGLNSLTSLDYTALETVSGSGLGSGAIAGITPALSRGFIQSTSGNNTFRGDITVNAGGISRIGTQDGASLTLTGAITQATGSMYFRPGDTGGEYITLSNSSNSFGGNSVIYTNNATTNYSGVRLGVNDALPTTLTISGETGTGAGTALDLNGKNQKLNGLTGSTPTLNIINSNTVNNSTLTLENLVDRSTTSTLIRGGVGMGTINVIKEGAFTQTLSGSHDYTGTTAVSAGTLVINGNISTSSLTTVASGATIGGAGTTGALTVNTGGFVTPGNSPGILNVNGAYTQAGTFTAEISGLTAGTQHDQINVSGTVDITGGSLSTLFTGSYLLNDIVFILRNDNTDAVTGTFTGLSQGAVAATYGGFNWEISYLADSVGSTFTGGNDIALRAIPEPRAALLGGLGLLALLRRRR